VRGYRDSSGISTVIGFILVLALIVTVAAAIDLTYVPDAKKQLEAEHMQQVIDQIGRFKEQLDLAQAASASTGTGYTATAYVEMGGGAIPVIDASSSSGTLSLDPAYGAFRIDAYDLHGNAFSISDATALGRLTFRSDNRYYVDQDITYEDGMIVLAQPGGSVMLAPPSFAISADPHVPGHPIVSINVFRLNGTPQTFSSAGRGAIRTWLMPGSSALTRVNVTNVTFTVVSDHARLWYDYLAGELAASGLDPGDNYALRLLPDGRTVTLYINSSTSFPSLYVTDSSFGTVMGYNVLSPEPSATPTPTPTPTPGPAPVVQFASTQYEGMAGSIIPVLITRSGDCSGPSSVDYAITGGSASPGTNYTISPSPGTILFGAGETSRTIAIYTKANTIYTGNLTVNLQLSSPVNATLGHNVSMSATIVDNMAYVRFGVAGYSGAEGGGTVQIMVVRGGNAAIRSNVSFYVSAGNATLTTDYALSPAQGVLTFNPGETTKLINVTIVDDATVEFDEYFNLTLRTNVNCTIVGPATTTTNIVDNDLHHFAISASVPWLPGSSDNITVTAYTRSNRMLTTYGGSVYFTSSNNKDTFDYNSTTRAYTFTPADAGTHVFRGNAHLFYTAGTTHTVTVRSTLGGVTAAVAIVY